MPSHQFSLPSRRSSLVHRRRRRSGASRRAGLGRHASGGLSTLSLRAEPLERRALLAVTASLAGTDLQIVLLAADDVAYLSNDGTNYIVRGTGLSGYAATLANVNSVLVAGTAGANQAFTVAAGVGAVLVDSLSVAASVESTSVVGAIDTAGAVTIGSGLITLAADVTTTGKQDYQGDVGLVGTRTLAAGTGDVAFGGKVDSSALLFADPDAFAAGTTLTTAYPGITLSNVGTSSSGTAVKSGNSVVSTPTTGNYAPTGNRIFSSPSGGGDWNAPGYVFKAAFGSTVTSVSLDFAPNDDFDPNAYLEAYDASGNLVANATYAPAIPELSFVTLTVSAPSIAYVLASFDPNGGNTGLLDNLRATLATTPAAALTVNTSGTTTFGGVVGGTAALASLTTDVGGTTIVASSAITTVNDQVFKDAYVLKADTTLTSNNNGRIAFLSTVDSYDTTYRALTVNTGGSTEFGDGGVDYVGNTNRLLSLTTDAGGSTQVWIALSSDATPSIRTENDQTYNDAVVLKADTVLTTTTGDIDFTSTLDGGYTLTIDAAKDVYFRGQVGNVTPLAGIALKAATSVTASDTLKLDGTTPRAGGTATPFADGLTISNNVNGVSFVTPGSVIRGFAGDGIRFLGNSKNSTLAGFTIYGNGSDGIQVDAGDFTGSRIRSNSIGLGGLFTAPAGGIQITLAGDQTGSLLVGQTVGLLPQVPALGGLVSRTVAAASLAGGNTLVTLSAPVDATTTAGSLIVGNGSEGIHLNAAGGSITNLAIGGDKTTSPSQSNSISSNTSDGIQADRGVYTGTVIQGNKIFMNGANGIYLNADGGEIGSLLIGAGAGGDAKFGNSIYANTQDGILVGTGTYTGTTIGSFNEIGLNNENGIELAQSGATSLTIGGNFIGTLADGSPRGNRLNGIEVNKGTYTGTTIRTNSIASNEQDGISLSPAGGSITGLTIGGDGLANQGNAIAGNGSDGIEADAGTYTSTVIQGNRIGSPNLPYVTLAGLAQAVTPGDQRGFLSVGQAVALKSAITGGWAVRTVNAVFISGGDTFITIDSAIDAVTTSGILVTGNVGNGINLNAAGGTLASLTIGGDATKFGNSIYANTKDGILVGTGTYTGTTIGSFNEIGLNNENGIELAASGATSLTVVGNAVGTLADGTTVRGNRLNGIEVNKGTYTGTTIRTNTVAFNEQDGISLSPAGGSITGLAIGGDKTAATSQGNSIYGNASDGIEADAGTYTGTVIQGNEVSQNVQNGIFLNANSGTLGGLLVGGSDRTTRGNTIDGNGATTAQNGIAATAGDLAGTTIVGNTIRDNGNTTTGVGNGILVEGSNLMVGWDANSANNTARNVISGNALNGIEVRGAAAQNNTILSNSIFLNGQGLTQVVDGNTVLVGEGIALTAGGNGAQVAPTIYDVVRDSKNGKVLVQLTVPASGSYLVQLFASNATDEQGIFPVDVNGFQGRTFVGVSPSGSPGPVGTGKPIISGTPVAGNTLVAIEVDASLVAAGDWITATATLLDGTTPTNTSGFSAGVQALAGQNFAVGADAPATWTPDLPYVRVNQNEIRVFTPNVRTAVALHSYRNAEIVLAPAGAAAGTTVVRTVTSVTCVGRNVVRLRLKPGESLPAGGGSMFLAPVSLPAARLYDAGNGTVMLDVTPARMVAALTDPTMVGIGGRGMATNDQATAFVSRFQGGIRVASADVNGDGFVDLVTAPGGGTGMPGGVFGDTPRIITIYNGNPTGTWQSSSINVSGEAGLAAYAAGFQVSLANVRPENTGSGNAVAELVVASTNKVFVYEMAATSRGAKPIIDPVAKSVITTVGSVTGLTAGTFTDPVLADIVVATTTATQAQVMQWLGNKDASQALNRPASVTVYSAAANLAPTSTFTLGQNQSNGSRLQNIFIGGAALAVGDIDNAPDQRPELILGAQSMGLANIRVLPNAVVAVGNQATVDAALAGGLNVPSRAPTTTLNGKQVWQPTGGPDYFTGMSSVPNAVALGANAPVTMAVVDSNGNGRAEIFAALGATNSTGNVVRRLEWNGVNAWDGASTLAGAGSIAVLPAPGSAKSRFPLGRGLRLG